MLSIEENELVTKTGPGTPMGETMRRYWLPALIDWEVAEPDGTPVRVQLLGERLIAFRDTNGRVGLLDEFCPHRGASLWLGRNEECGLRCVFHGWKYDADGNCVDQMNEPTQFGEKVTVTSYPTVEEGGVIWAYLGPRELMPPPPKFDWTQVPAANRSVSKVVQDCNWLQGVEGGIDTSHAQILHRNFVAGIGPTGPGGRGDAPKLDLDLTDYGYRYAGIYPRPEGNFVRSYHFVMPFTQIRPTGRELQTGIPTVNDGVAGHIWVPIDDNTCMVWNWQYNIVDRALTEDERLEQGLGNGPDAVDQTTFRSHASLSNGWNISRDAQRTKSMTGIAGVNTQDRAIQESMGTVVDRSQEHLGPADRAIIVARQMLLQAIETVSDGGSPPGVGDSYYAIRAMQDTVPHDSDWRDTLLPLMHPAGV